ncbi:MAG: extracellular solute-binding protein [Clostridia bacterium]|nr:extracellular solute-binding protein [Clostridia bacterium]
MLKRTITLLLAAAMLTTAAACGSENNSTNGTTTADTTTTTEPVETEPTEKLELPEGLDYEGYTFTIMTRPSTRANEIMAEDETGETLNDAVHKRNGIVEELLNIQFEYVLSSSDYETDALNTILADDDAYDIVFPAARAAFVYAQNDVCVNWFDVPNLDLTKSWWIQDIVENFAINGKLYTMTGDLSYASLESSVGMVFNKNLFDDYKMDYPYELVESGEWTFDKFAEMAQTYSRDINGDNELTIAKDQFGYGTNHWCGPINALYCTGERIITLNSEGLPELTLYSEKVVDVYDKFMNLLLSDCGWNQLGGTDHQAAFCDGRFAFVDVNVKHLSQGMFRESDVDFGLVPWPKYDENVDKYYNFVDAGSSLGIIPVTNSDLARTGAVLEAMSYYGQQLVIPAYYDITLQGKLLRDDMSIAMLDYINEGRTFDLGYYNNTQFGGKLANPGYNLVHDTTLSFTTLYSTYEQSVLTLIENSTAMYLDEE